MPPRTLERAWQAQPGGLAATQRRVLRALLPALAHEHEQSRNASAVGEQSRSCHSNAAAATWAASSCASSCSDGGGGGRSELTRYAALHLAFHVAQAVETPSASASSGFADGSSGGGGGGDGGGGGGGGGGSDERMSQRRKSSGSVRARVVPLRDASTPPP